MSLRTSPKYNRPSGERFRARTFVLHTATFGLVLGLFVGCGVAGPQTQSTAVSALRPVLTTAGSPTESTTTQDSVQSSSTLDNQPQASPLHGDYVVEIVRELPHDPQFFTQGLEFHDGRLLESRGLRGESGRAWVEAQTGETSVDVSVADDEIFAEGITIVGDRFVQLSWQAGQAIVGDADTLQATDSFSFSGEGWGLCYDGTRLIRSDGTNTLTFHDSATFSILGSVQVLDANQAPVQHLNELECVAGQVIANVWGADYLVVINPSNGAVDAVIDAASLRPGGVPADLEHALNGTAYDSLTGTYYLTGKLWPLTFNVRLVSAS